MARSSYSGSAEHTSSVAYQTWTRLTWRSRYRHVEAIQIHPWPSWWLSQAMCIHHYEGAWNVDHGIGPQVSGGMQIGINEWYHFGGGAFAPAAYLATPTEQLTVAWRYYQVSGWSPWPSTRLDCGL